MHAQRMEISGIKRPRHAQREWGWPIAVYLYLAGLGAGAFAVGSALDLLVHPSTPSRALLLWGPLFVALGAPFLVLDLGKKMRFLNACLNPRSSWAARGFLILSSLIVVGLAAFALAALPGVLPIFGLATPNWIASQTVFLRTAELVGLVLSLGTAAYTGVFLKSVKYVSLWNSRLLPVLFVFSALSTGSMALIAVLSAFGIGGGDSSLVALARAVLPAAAAFIVLEGAVLAILLFSLNRSEKASAEMTRHLAVNSAPSLVVGLALAVVASSTSTSSAGSFWSAFPILTGLSAASILFGGFLLRYDIVMNGTKDDHPMHRMAAMRHDWQSAAAPVAATDASRWIDVPTSMPPVYAAKHLERPLFEVAFSLFVARPRDSARAHVRVIAALYGSWRRPLRLEYTTSPEAAS